jgi:hypothetical protein
MLRGGGMTHGLRPGDKFTIEGVYVEESLFVKIMCALFAVSPFFALSNLLSALTYGLTAFLIFLIAYILFMCSWAHFWEKYEKPGLQTFTVTETE